MKNIGIVCEYNPFHNGHAKQLAFVRSHGAAICLMSGNYVQRGEPAILDKWTRARAAVRCGADLVLELPVTYALRSAEGFADGAVELFSRLGCIDALCFGSETGALDEIMSTAEILLSEMFAQVLRTELDTGVSFPTARQRALEKIGKRLTINNITSTTKSEHGEEISEKRGREEVAAEESAREAGISDCGAGEMDGTLCGATGEGRDALLDSLGKKTPLASTQLTGADRLTINIIMSTKRREREELHPDVALRGRGSASPASSSVNRMGTINSALLEKPNDILAVEYCKSILRRGGKIQPLVIQRAGDYHGGSEQENPSASFLRGSLDWSEYVPAAVGEEFFTAPRYRTECGERAFLARLRGMSESDFERLPYGSEGLWRRLMRACRTERNLEAVIAATKSKRYTRTRIMRMLLCAFLGVDAECLAQPAPYVRVLATNERGQEILRQIRRTGEIPLLHTGDIPPRCEYAELERRAADLFSLFAESEPPAPGMERRSRLFRFQNMEKNPE